MRTVFWLLLVSVLSISLVAAQDTGDCPALVEQALATVGTACTGLGRNQVCYGNFQADAQGRDGTQLAFAAAGDRVSVGDIAELTTAPLNQEDKTWGIVVMALQANLPDTLPGQNVTFVAFGDVALENDVSADAPRLPATAKGNINVRSGPGTNFAKASALKKGDAVSVVARTESNQWLQILYGDESGWASAALLDVQGDLGTLNVVESGPALLNPMQAFRIRSTPTATSCDKAPPDGVLIQSPEGVKVNFSINGVGVTLGSTALVRALDGDTIRVLNLGGQVTVTTGSKALTLKPGQAINVTAGTPPGTAENYTADDVQLLPLKLLPITPSVPPVITGVQTTTIIGNGQNQAIPIIFLNGDGDAIVNLHQRLISSTAGSGPSGDQPVTPAEYDDNPFGGTLGYLFGCATNGTISLTYEITITDAAGNVSAPYRYTLTCTPP